MHTKSLLGRYWMEKREIERLRVRDRGSDRRRYLEAEIDDKTYKMLRGRDR